MTKRVCGILVAMALCLMALPAMAQEKIGEKKVEEKVAANASVGVFSNYVWRGIKLSKGIVFQPSATAAYNDFSLNLWANMDPNVPAEGDDELELTETDVTLSYGTSIDKLSLGGGYIYYAFDGLADTQEAYVTAAYDTILSPTLHAYYDFDEGTGWYIMASVSHSLSITEELALNLGAYASYTADNAVMGLTDAGEEVSDFYNAQVSASVDIPISEKISLSPMLAYSFALSDDAEEAIKNANIGGDSDVLYGGVTLTLSF